MDVVSIHGLNFDLVTANALWKRLSAIYGSRIDGVFLERLVSAEVPLFSVVTYHELSST